MKAFQQRNPVWIALAGILLLGMGLVAAANSDDLPVIGSGTVYEAEFDEAAGLESGNEVRVAGIKVGKVKDVELTDTGVQVSFYVKDAWMGDQSRAGIKLKSLLGTKFLAVDPAGDNTLDPANQIPLERTTSPYDVLEAFRDLSGTVDDIDTDQLAESFTSISDTLSDTPEEFSDALSGLSDLSDTISKRDSQLRKLLNNTKQITGTLADRDKQLVQLVKDGNVLLEELSKRKEAISSVLRGTRELSKQLNGLVDDNQKQIGPVLKDLDRLTGMLHRNEESLADSINSFAPFLRQFNNVLGNGRWFDNYICGLVPPGAPGINEGGCDPRR